MCYKCYVLDQLDHISPQFFRNLGFGWFSTVYSCCLSSKIVFVLQINEHILFHDSLVLCQKCTRYQVFKTGFRASTCLRRFLMKLVPIASVNRTQDILPLTYTNTYKYLYLYIYIYIYYLLTYPLASVVPGLWG